MYIVFALFLAGCTAARPVAGAKPFYWPTGGWRTTTPEMQGIDSRILADGVRTIRELSLPVHSLLIIRGGNIVLDAYFYPYSKGVPHDIASVTKSVTSALVGLASDRGKLGGVEEKLPVWFPELRGSEAGRSKEAITIEHLLTMTSGIECGYPAENALRWQADMELLDVLDTKDFPRYVRDLPMKAEPGSEFEYCNVNYHLLSAILTRATGMSTGEFAMKRLFEPLGIRDVAWPADPSGIHHGWGDLRMHPVDMAKIGYLYRYGGVWENRRLLSASWIERSLKKHADVAGVKDGYGYGWWVSAEGLRGPFEARGRGGQAILVDPEKEIVVVVTGAGYDGGVLTRLFRPSLKSDRALPEDREGNALLHEAVSAAALPPPPKPVPAPPATARYVSGKTFRMEPNLFGIESVSFRFPGGEEALLRIAMKRLDYEVPIGLDGVSRLSRSSFTGIPVASKGGWKGERTFFLEYAEAAGPTRLALEAEFKGKEATVRVMDGPNTISVFSGKSVAE